MTPRLLVALCITAAAFPPLVCSADPRPAVPPVDNKNKVKEVDDVDPKARVEEAANQQERLRRQFEEFKQSLLRLKQRLENSPKPEDREKAKILDEALTRASEQGTDSKFSTLVAALKGAEAFKDLDQLGTILDKNEELRKDLHALIELLLRDDRDAEARKKKEQLSRMLEQLKEVILKQEKIRAQTELARKNAADLEKLQKKVTEDTKDLVDRRDAKKSEPGDGKKSDPKKGGKPGDKKDGKPAEPKPGESKPGEPKPGEPKPGEPKPGEPKPGEPKPGEPKPGEPKPSEPKPGEKSDSQQADKQQQETNPVKKQIQDANKYQEEAEKKLEEKKNSDAVAKQDKALEKLKEAQKRLEDLLKQLREEEKERLLAALQARCVAMLAMQIAVRDGTVGLDKDIDKKEPNREQQQNSNVLSDKEEEIIREASKAIGIIQAEGSAIAFAEVFLQVRGDMTTVAGRLRKTDTGLVTQTIENDIIATLQEMIEALKKARQDNKNPPRPSQQQQGQPPDQRLIDMIAELKMIRSMQLRVNSRTEVYGKQYEGEQAPPPSAATEVKAREQYEMIQRELHELGERQLKIEKVTSDIAKGKNKAN
jgi:hypothetical protein